MNTPLVTYTEDIRSHFDRITDIISLTHDEIDSILGIRYSETPIEKLSAEVLMRMQKLIEIERLLDMSYESEISLGNIWERGDALSTWFRGPYPSLDSTRTPLECIILNPDGYLDRILELLNVEYTITAKAYPGLYRSEKYGNIIDII